MTPAAQSVPHYFWVCSFGLPFRQQRPDLAYDLKDYILFGHDVIGLSKSIPRSARASISVSAYSAVAEIDASAPLAFENRAIRPDVLEL